MYIAETVKELTDFLEQERTAGKTIGFVPTMGALHAGHASLVSRSVKENDITVVSIFVNPTQFNDKNDLANYPRTLEADAQLLERIGVDYVFAPNAEEIYPEPDTRYFDYPPITSVMEGPRRPGHFNGVCQIVSKLFDIVKPHRAYFGEKDFQQIAVVRAMIEELHIPVELCPCPIVREESGLALSSRNTLLTGEERKLAVNISRILFISVDYAQNHSVKETHDFVVNTLNALNRLDVEYFEIVNACTLQNVTAWTDATEIQGCITVYCGKKPIRLIDNIKYKG
ncbi:pantothenate synthetase [Alloprevotella rava F0323]|uniref:Pantothenate synthetase n=1 Tax=Alloprevotella rava F0323 TaxID=679199 RepID=G5GDL6_9BACT|nr:pantoate--beta-alanine ligase [Alloprevotella rava]EHG21721.1 pantothenate synthetase [Alloprevotella rava F0323]